jgi:2'-5' RNA ligase
MPRVRLGVALLVPEPLATEISGLRRALRDPNITRIPPHLTLVPPVNVRVEALDQALAVLRDAASSVPPLSLLVGPVATFSPLNPVVYLAVGGEQAALAALVRLRDSVFRAPLHRQVDHPFVPHVTLHDDIDSALITPVIEAMAAWSAEVMFDQVTLLREDQPGRIWRPIAHAPLGGPAVIGTGGLAVSLDLTPAAPFDARHATRSRSFAVTARREGAVVGLLEGRVVEGRALEEPASEELPSEEGPVLEEEPVLEGPVLEAWIEHLVVVPSHRRQGIGSALLAQASSHAAAGGCAEMRLVLAVTAEGSAVAKSFLTARGFESLSEGELPLLMARRL